MHVEIHDSLRRVARIPTTRVVIYDDYENPIAVVVQIETGQYVAATAANDNFNKILHSMGINRTLIVDKLNPKLLKQLN